MSGERSSFNEVGKYSKRLDPLMLLDRDVCINIQIAINVTPILEAKTIFLQMIKLPSKI